VIPEIDRRTFLRGATGAGTLLALGGALPLGACTFASAGAPPADLAVLSPRAWATLASFADYVIPRGGAFEAGAADVGVASLVDRWLDGADPQLVTDLRRGLALLEWGPLLLGFAARPLTALAPESAGAYLASLPSSRFGFVRQLHAALSELCLLAFYSTHSAWRAIGYDGPIVVGSAESTEWERR
jgi:hypothetical protein